MSKKLTDMWFEEFRTSVVDTENNLFCGLCANHGIIRTAGLRTPAGVALKPFEGFCICPNGRKIKKALEAKHLR